MPSLWLLSFQVGSCLKSTWAVSGLGNEVSSYTCSQTKPWGWCCAHDLAPEPGAAVGGGPAELKQEGSASRSGFPVCIFSLL